MATAIVLVGLLLRLHRQRRPGGSGHRHGEVDGAEHRAGAPDRDGGHAGLLGIESTSADRRLGRGEQWLTRGTTTRRGKPEPTTQGEPGRPEQPALPGASPAYREDAARPTRAAEQPAARARARRRDVPDNIVDQTREGEEPYQWHSGLTRDHGSTDAIEFIDVQEVLRPQHDPQRPEPGHPRQPDLDDPGAVGHRQVGLHQAHGRPALPGRGRRAGARRVGAEHGRRRAVRDAQEVRRPVPGRRAVRLDERAGQRGVPAAPAHRQVGRGDPRDLPPAAARGGAAGRDGQDAQRALGRHAQARGLRARAGARPRHRALRRARLRASTPCARPCCAS